MQRIRSGTPVDRGMHLNAHCCRGARSLPLRSIVCHAAPTPPLGSLFQDFSPRIGRSNHGSQPSELTSNPAAQRRGLLLGLALAPLPALLPDGAAPAAHAESGPNPLVQFWLSRQQVNYRKLLAPILASKQRLSQAQSLLAEGTDVSQVLQLVRASSLNCYVFEPNNDDSIETRASLMTQSLQLTDPCTFRIIARSITELLPNETQEQGRARVEDIVLAYQKLDAYLDMALEGSPDALPKASTQLDVTLKALVHLEDFVREVLNVPIDK